MYTVGIGNEMACLLCLVGTEYPCNGCMINRSYSDKSPAMHYMLVLLIVNIFFVSHLNAADCTGQTYKDVSFTEPKNSFSPYDRVFIKIDCKQVTPGSHSLQVNWIHHTGGIVRTDQTDFTIGRQEQSHTAYFWFKLTRRGPIQSALTNRDFFPGHMGDWSAEAVLDDEVVAETPFFLAE